MKLLDSSVLVDIDRGGGDVAERVARLDVEGRHAVSAVTVTELFYGIEQAYRSAQEEEDGEAYPRAVGALEALVNRFEVLPITRPVAITAAQLIHELRSRGRALDDLHDVYIAATGLVHRLVVLTANKKHFARVEGLVVEDWRTY